MSSFDSTKTHDMYTAFLILHIVAGHIALIAGAVAMIAKKGSTIHVKSGRFFFYSMLGVSASALFMTALKPNVFLFHIALFVLYQVWNGFKAVKVKSLKPDIFQWVLLIVGFWNGYAMLLSQVVVLMVFGGIQFALCLQDAHLYYQVIRNRPKRKNAPLLKHIGHMTGAYIGAITAFIVVNIQIEGYGWLLWLAPTFILVPFIVYHSYRYSK